MLNPCAEAPSYLYLIPSKKHPDKLLEDFLFRRGEFSIWADLAFERRLYELQVLREQRARIQNG